MVEKIFATSNSIATISCTECGKTKTKDVSKFIKHETQVKLKYKCGCRHSFSVILERRLSIRKNIRLTGHLVQKSKKNTIVIENLSRTGLKLKTLGKINLKEGETIKLEFVLDDPNRSKVSKRVGIIKIIKINSRTDICCEFLNQDLQGNLGKYFFFYF